MPPGKLREKITFESLVKDKIGDGAGNFVEDKWKALRFAKDISARIDPMKGREDVVALKLQGQTVYEIKVRYRTALCRITSDNRIRNCRTGEIYSISAPPVNEDEKKRFLTFMCKTGLADAPRL